MSSHCVRYEIVTLVNGAIEIAVTTTTGRTVWRRDLASHTEANDALQDLRAILAALGHDLIQSGGPALA